MITLSWNSGYIWCGATVILLHNISDVLLHTSKLCNYVTEGGVAATVTFALLLMSWAPLRLWFYPQLAYESWKANFARAAEMPLHKHTLDVLLLVLIPLHFYWFYLMLQILIRALAGGPKTDIREDGVADGSQKDKRD